MLIDDFSPMSALSDGGDAVQGRTIAVHGNSDMRHACGRIPCIEVSSDSGPTPGRELDPLLGNSRNSIQCIGHSPRTAYTKSLHLPKLAHRDPP